MATNTGRTPEWAILRSIQRGISAFPRLTEGRGPWFCCCAVLGKPCHRALLPQERQQNGRLERHPAQRGRSHRLIQRKRDGNRFPSPTFRPSSFFSLRAAAKKNAGPQFPVTGLPPSPFVLPEPLCFSCSVFLALLFFVLLFAGLAGYSRNSLTATRISRPPFFVHAPAVLHVPCSRLPVFLQMPLSGVDRLFCDRINRSSDALFLSCA